ncbi:hypothetical protein HDZ31DRAFT_38779 [Schizophyllum fasciatum]
MPLLLSGRFNDDVAASTTHIPSSWDAFDDDPCSLSRLSEVLSRALRAMYKENNIYADPSHVSLAACFELLSNSADAVRILRDVHRTKEYESLFEHSYFRPPGLAQPYTLFDADSAVSSEVEEIVRGAQAELQTVADGTRTYKTWRSISDDPAHDNHIASLKIPENQGRPALVLHDIGRMIDEDELGQRLSKIFNAGFDTFFVNVSGSGKTRLLYEGLSRNWGLYLTAKVDSSRLGSTSVDFVTCSGLRLSNKLRALPHPSAPNYMAIRRANMRILTHRYKDVLLSYALMMREFLQLACSTGLQDVHKARWLQCQLQAVTLGVQDPFRAIAAALLKASDEFVDHTLGQVINDIRERLQGAPLFVTLDESQALGYEEGTGSSKYGLPSRDARPYLRQLVLAWRGRPGLSLIITGTELPKDVLQEEPLEMECGQYRWCSATGGFDEEGSNRHYLRRYFPPTFVRSQTGHRLLDRLGRWLRGRHRLTAAFITLYIRFGLPQPHQQLNDYICNGTGYCPEDAKELSAAEGVRIERAKRVLGALPFHSMRVPLIRSTVHRSLFNLSVRPSSALQYDYAHVDVVTQAIGRFVDDDACRIAIDEPYLLVSCAQWFRSTAARMLDLDYLRLVTHAYPKHVSEFRCEVLAYVLARRLEAKPDLRRIFSFVGPSPPWANARTTRLLLLHNTANGRRSARAYLHTREAAFVTPMLATTVSTEAEITRWLEHADVSPFCILRHTASSSLLFAVSLSSDRNLWVLLDGEPGDELSSTEITERMSRMDPCANFSVEQLGLMRNIPNPSLRAGDPPFLFAFASSVGDPPVCDRAVATVDLAELSDGMEISPDEVMQRVVRTMLPEAAKPSSGRGKRSTTTDLDPEGSARASKRRFSTQAPQGQAGRVLRASTTQQRRAPIRRTTR